MKRFSALRSPKRIIVSCSFVLLFAIGLYYSANCQAGKWEGKYSFKSTNPVLTLDTTVQTKVNNLQVPILQSLNNFDTGKWEPEAAIRRVLDCQKVLVDACKWEGVPEEFASVIAGQILIESGGQAFARSPAYASGICQFLKGAGEDCGLKMELDTAGVKTLLAKRTQAIAASNTTAQKAAEEELAAKDERFDRDKAIRACVHYSYHNFENMQAWDFAIAAYHSGYVGLANFVHKYTGDEDTKSAILIKQGNLRLDKMVDDPTHKAAYDYLRGLDDQSWAYWYKCLAGRELIRKYQEDKPAFDRLMAEAKK